MTPDLKQEILDILPDAIFDMRGCSRHADADRLEALCARISKATITERVEADRFAAIEGRLATLTQQMARVEQRAFDLPDGVALGSPANPTPPTDAELLDALRLELGEGWDTLKEPRYFSCTRRGMNWFLYGSCAALRRPNGIKRTADALRWLAQQGVE